jgi:hypothetical protein
MTLFKGQASWAKMTSPGAMVTTLACHLPQKVNNTEELTYFSTNIGYNLFWKGLFTYTKLREFKVGGKGMRKAPL